MRGRPRCAEAGENDVTSADAHNTALVFRVDQDRLTAPGGVEPREEFRVCAIGHHWCELSDSPDTPALPASVVIGTGRRFRLPSGFIRNRFAVDTGDRLLSVLARIGSSRWMLIVALDSVEWTVTLDLSCPPDLYSAGGLHSPWSARRDKPPT